MSGPLRILLIEDSPDDAELLRVPLQQDLAESLDGTQRRAQIVGQGAREGVKLASDGLGPAGSFSVAPIRRGSGRVPCLFVLNGVWQWVSSVLRI